MATAKKSRKKADDESPRIARRERRRERSREEIVDAARRVIAKHGLAGTTLDLVAAEIGLTKAAIYYYFPSKDALFFELIYDAIAAQAEAMHAAVAKAHDGGEALRAIVRETMGVFVRRMDDFRLVFLSGQVMGPGAVKIGSEQLAKVRPLNDVSYGGTAKLLEEQWAKKPARAKVNPRLMTFLASCAAIGVLTFKGMVEAFDDPLRYSDEELMEALARIFEAAAAPE